MAHNIINYLGGAARNGNGNAHSNGTSRGEKFDVPSDITRAGATTPAEKRLSRPLETLMVPHKVVKRICCIGAGYVGEHAARFNCFNRMLIIA